MAKGEVAVYHVDPIEEGETDLIVERIKLKRESQRRAVQIAKAIEGKSRHCEGVVVGDDKWSIFRE